MAGEATGSPAPDLQNLVAKAIENNQELLASIERAEALRIEVPASGALKDPVVGLGLLNVPVDSFELDQEPMTQKQLFVAQKFPWFGTLGLKQQIAALAALEAGSRVEAKKLAIASAVSVAWYELAVLERSIEIMETLREIVNQSLRVAESRYGTGKGLQQDVLVGQVQLSELLGETISLESGKQAAKARLGKLTNLTTTDYQEFSPNYSTIKDTEIPEVDRESLVAAALNYNPLLQEKMIAVDRARVKVDLARAGYRPDFDVRLSYGQREENPTTGDDRADFFSATVAMTVPLYQTTKQDVKLEAARKRLRAAENSLESYKRNLLHDLERKIAELTGLKGNHTLFTKGRNSQASHLAQASLAAYSVGKVDFKTMLEARMGLLRLELKTDVVKSKLLITAVELEQLIGVSHYFSKD